MTLINPQMAKHAFLTEMYRDPYFPDELVKQCESILVDLCREIERSQPASLESLYKLTHAATERINDLQEVFEEQGSEIETGAREALADDFMRIAKAYGFVDADGEELVATRDW